MVKGEKRLDVATHTLFINTHTQNKFQRGKTTVRRGVARR